MNIRALRFKLAFLPFAGSASLLSACGAGLKLGDMDAAPATGPAPAGLNAVFQPWFTIINRMGE